MAARSEIPVGSEFGRLTVIGVGEPKKRANGSAESRSRCKCECGTELDVLNWCLRNGHTRSCGCLSREVTGNTHRKHGRSGTNLYDVWITMRKRCESENDPSWPRYGGRGISVCERWKSFAAFAEDMGERPSSRHTVEREDNDGPYSPDNCRWATYTVQCRNRRNTVRVECGGIVKTLAEWCDGAVANYFCVYARLKMGWDLKTALDTPVGKRRIVAETS